MTSLMLASLTAPPVFPPCPVPRVRRLGAGAHPAPPPPPSPVAPPEADPVDPAVRQAITTAMRRAQEVLDWRRPAGQLASLFEPAPLRYWRAEAARRPGGGSARLLRTRLCGPDAATVEVAATCRVDGRVRAVAARFEQRGPTWVCSAVRLI